MCAQCVAQGALYAGGSLVALRVMGARARARVRRRGRDEAVETGRSGDEYEVAVPSGRAPGA